MKLLNYFLYYLDDAVKYRHIKNTITFIPSTIILLDGNTAAKPGSLCIGSQAEILHTVKNFTIPKDVIFFATKSKDDKHCALPNINLIETNLPLIPLYNKLNTALAALNVESGQTECIFPDFDSFFRDIASMKLSGEEEIKAAMRSLSYSSDDPYNIIVIESQNVGTISSYYEKLRQAVLQIFPSCNITLFANRLVIMYHNSKRTVAFPPERKAKLQKCLEEYDAFAGISNQTLNFEMIRTEYIIASNILNIAKKMRPSPDERVFLQEEYGVYYILHLCYKQFEQTFHHHNILYLTHPGLSALIRYDASHHTNLREVLLCYLLNDRSLTKTSKLLFMHRNTTMNKINKITEIIEDDLEDAIIRQRLLFSCMLYDYCQKYCYKPFLVTALPDQENHS